MTSTSDNSYLSSDQKAISSVFSLMTCLDRCGARLDDWNKVEFGHVGKTIVDLQKHLEWLKRQPMSPKNIQSMKATRVNLNCWLEKEDAMWLQRSHIS